jgi:hypothetical protein
MRAITDGYPADVSIFRPGGKKSEALILLRAPENELLFFFAFTVIVAALILSGLIPVGLGIIVFR